MEKGASGVQPDGGKRSRVLAHLSHVRISKDVLKLHIFRSVNDLLPPAIHLVAERSKGGRWIRIFLPEPCRACIFRLQNRENSFACPQNFFTRLPHGRYVLLHWISGGLAPDFPRS
jgi:hypothetical protein